MPDVIFETMDAVPEGLREYAKRNDDGKVTVNVVPKVKLDEFRDTNIRISQERDQAKVFIESVRPFVGEDPAAFKARLEELQGIAQQVHDGKLKGSADVESELTRRTAQMKTEFERQNQEKAREAAEWRQKAELNDQKYRRTLIDRAVTDAVLNERSGAEARALPDILARAYSIFTVQEDGKIVAKDGEAVIYGADGATPMTALEWLGKLKEHAPYFFKNSNGGGANGGGMNQGGTRLPNGLTQADFDKLPAAEKLKAARRMERGVR